MNADKAPIIKKSKFYIEPEFRQFLVKKTEVYDEELSGFFYTYCFRFPNRFGLYLYKNPYMGPGYEKDLWEMRIIHWNRDPWCDFQFIPDPDTRQYEFHEMSVGQINQWLRRVKDWSFDKYKEV